FMAGNLTDQVRGIAKVVTAVANGDLKRKLVVEAKGEIAELADTINNMIDTLATFADQVTGVAREVGVEGKLGGQASVPGAAGTWKDLTDNVNQLAANLSTQVRAIADVATAVTRGDLTRAIDVAAQGEVAALKDNINEMIRNLRETTLKNAETDWLKTNLAKFSRMLQGQKDLLTVARLILSELAPVVSAQHGVFYILDAEQEETRLKLLASYAYKERKNLDTSFKLGEALVGQCALEKQKIVLSQVPGDYIRITSGLGDAPPLNVIVMPVVFETQVKAVIELASFDRFSETHQAFLEQLTESIGIVINTIEANTLTEDLLSQSQSLAHELQSRQAELTTTNAELEEKAELLAQQNAEVERKNREVELARQALEEKAKQLALTSKYKSEFLANMSHELRTPLNSLLILSDHLCRNLEGNLDDRQVEYARTIHSSGNDLLALINDILDLSKIESGTVVVDVGEVRLRDLVEHVERAIRPVADSRGLEFLIEVAPGTPRSMHTDIKRLQQILKNLLSNAFKFTERGRVSLRLEKVASGWAPENQGLSDARSVLAFAVVDTGVGIPPEKQLIVFEAFQQADGSTSRKYGGTGLGLAISREIAQLLGGELKLSSAIGQGSSFTLYLPQVFVPPRATRAAAPPVGAELAQNEAFVAEKGRGEPASHADPVSDDREDLRPGDSVLLVIGSNLAVTGMLMDRAHDRGLKAVTVPHGAAGLGWARERPPAFIALDVNLPDVDGWQILERLKDDLDLRHIPVYAITTEEERRRALRMGAAEVLSRRLESREAVEELFATLDRHSQSRTNAVLVMDDDRERLATIEETLSGLDAEVYSFENVADGMALMTDLTPNLVVVGAGLAQAGAADLLDDAALRLGITQVPVLVYGPPTRPRGESRAPEMLPSLLGPMEVHTRDRVLHDAALYLHCRVDSLGDAQRATLREIRERRPGLAGKKVLIVDDDIRNIFAMTSLLERYQMKVLAEETARGALRLLHTQPDVEVILMDIMMPDLDGYDAIGMIRQTERFRALPIIALTARAMKGDREKCIEAGASDYIAKPVDGDYLIAMIHHWLFR
ncbi:MAG: response regulator, partial [Vicinamibacteria bacterium]